MSGELLALAARVEAAIPADTNAMRALGREVLLAAGRGYVSPLYAWSNPVLSVDAALSLIPVAEMRLLDIELGFEPPHAEVWPAASVRWYPPHKEGHEWHAMVVTAATLPLTITAAALRARAANADEVSA